MAIMILLSILKVILWILLILLLLILYLLLVPWGIRGRFRLDEEEKSGSFTIKSFLRCFQLLLDYSKEKKVRFEISLFWGKWKLLSYPDSEDQRKTGKKKGFRKKRKKDRTDEENLKDPKDFQDDIKKKSLQEGNSSAQSSEGNDGNLESGQTKTSAGTDESNQNIEDDFLKDKEAENQSAAAESCEEQAERKKSSRSSKEREKRKDKKKDRKNGWQNFREKVSKIFRLLRKVFSEPGKAGIHKIRVELFGFLRRLGLHFTKTEIHFAGSGPDVTGEILGVLAMIPWAHQPGLKIRPDFTADKAYFTGHGQVRGHLLVGDLLLTVIRLLMDKNVRTLLHAIGGNKK